MKLGKNSRSQHLQSRNLFHPEQLSLYDKKYCFSTYSTCYFKSNLYTIAISKIEKHKYVYLAEIILNHIFCYSILKFFDPPSPHTCLNVSTFRPSVRKTNPWYIVKEGHGGSLNFLECLPILFTPLQNKSGKQIPLVIIRFGRALWVIKFARLVSICVCKFRENEKTTFSTEELMIISPLYNCMQISGHFFLMLWRSPENGEEVLQQLLLPLF